MPATGKNGQYILWNLYEATTINPCTTSVKGSILAPNAEYISTYTNMEGTLIVKNLSGNIKVHNYLFLGNLGENEPIGILVKAQSSNMVVSAGTITYTITITNNTINSISNFNLLDTIPTGMSYAAGTFKINGTPESPTLTGQDLSYQFAALSTGITVITFDCDVE